MFSQPEEQEAMESIKTCELTLLLVWVLWNSS